MREFVLFLKNVIVVNLLRAAVFVLVVIWLVSFVVVIVTIAVGTPDQQSRVYEIIVPGEKLHYYCNRVDRDGDTLTLTDCASSPKVAIENQVNVQIIERGKKK